jgi:WD40 repeat protein
LTEPPDNKVTELPPPPDERGESFYVVGGPVQPRRGCYVQRAADRQLLDKLREGEYCHLLAPPQTGKSSLVARTARELRRDGYLTAVVDLGQTVGRNRQAEAGRWYYGLAYRIVRDLRLGVDLQHWWQEKKPLPPLQRLNEFFWEIVLSSTRSPIVILLDEVESVADLDYAADLFMAVRACHDARASEPEYERLRFALVGTVLPSDPGASNSVSLFQVGQRVDLPDFTFEEARPLCREIGLAPGDAERALYRIFYWTGGHPYLTQKLCRAISRNPGTIGSDEDVDGIVNSRFLVGDAPQNEPNLRRTRRLAERRDPLSYTALRLFRKLRRGRKRKFDRHNYAQEWLRIAGLAGVSPDGMLQLRNQIYSRAFPSRWIRKSVPFDWQKIGKAAAFALLIVGLPYWYAQVLPRSFVAKLEAPGTDFQTAEQAYVGLRRLPGFGDQAERLFAIVLERQSAAAGSWDSALAIDVQLRALPGYRERADDLLAEFWQRQAASAEAGEMRDRALIYRLRALDVRTAGRENRASSLIGQDYPSLITGIRPGARIDALGIDASGSGVVTLTEGHLVQMWDAQSGRPMGQPGGFPALAEEFVTVRRRVSIETPGKVRNAKLIVTLRHPQPSDLQIRLVAPSGQAVVIPVRRQQPDDDPAFIFESASDGGIKSLTGENAQGTWTLEVEDQLTGTSGFLDGWELVLSNKDGHRVEDLFSNPILLADPRPTLQVEVVLSPDGRRVAAVSANHETRGFLQIWDTAQGTVTARAPVEAGPRVMAFDAAGQFLITGSAGVPGHLSVWRAAAGQELMSVDSELGFRTAPVVSSAGSVLAVAEIVTAGDSRVRLLDLAAMEERRSIGIAGEVSGLALGPDGGLLATLDRENVVGVWDTAAKRLLMQLPHDLGVQRMVFDPSGRWLATVDAGGISRVWTLGAADETGSRLIVSRDSWDPLSLTFSNDGALLLLRGRGRTFEVLSLPSGMPATAALRHSGDWRPDDGRSASGHPVSRAFGDQDSRIVTGRGGVMARVWAIPPRESATEASVTSVATAQEFALSPWTDQMVAGGLDGSIRFLDRGQPWNPPPEDMAGHAGAITGLAYSPDGRRLVSVGADGSVLVWDPQTRTQVGERFHHGSGRVRSVAIDSDDRLVLTGGELGARLWHIDTGEAASVLGPGRQVSSVAFSDGGALAATAATEGLIQIWDTTSGEPVWSGNMPGPVVGMSINGRGSRVAAGNARGDIYVWDTAKPIGGRRTLRINGWVLGLKLTDMGDVLYLQTGEWMHMLDVSDEPRITASALLPGSSPAQVWHIDAQQVGVVRLLSVDMDGHRIVQMDLRRPLPGAMPSAGIGPVERWLGMLKLSFDAAGVLVPVEGGQRGIVASPEKDAESAQPVPSESD